MAKEILNYSFVLAEGASIESVEQVAGQLIILDNGDAYYDASTGQRIKINDVDVAGMISAAIAAHNVLATADAMGHVKLVDTTDGEATDAAVTQKALKAKLDAIEASISEDLSGDIADLAAEDTRLAGLITEEETRAKGREDAIEGALNSYKTSNDAAVAANTSGVAENKAAIQTLTGTGEGSVKATAEAAAAAAAAAIVAGADENYDTLKEIADYIATDATGAAELSNKVAANEAAIKTINETTIPAVDAKADKNAEDILALDGELDALSGTVTQQGETLTTHIGNTNNPHSVTAAQVGAPTTAEHTALADRVTAVENVGKIVRYS